MGVVDRVLDATELLESVAADRSTLHQLTEEQRIRFINAVGDVFCPDVEERRQRVKALHRRKRAERVRGDEDLRAQTGIRRLRTKAVYTTPNVFPPEGHVQHDRSDAPPTRTLIDPHHCYVCKQPFSRVHHFYDQLCPPCAEVNYAKRSETADLRGRVALLTGGRVKIGYQAGIKLLRAGAELIVTTRFPRDSALRYAAEPDFEEWSERLEIYGLDLRHTPSVEAFCRHLDTSRSQLDFIVNNACQTVRRPPAFYRHMLELETTAMATMPEAAGRLLAGARRQPGGMAAAPGPDGGALAASTLCADDPAAVLGWPGLAHAARLSQAPLLPDEWEPDADLFPEGLFDQDRQQVDLRDRNSWRLTLSEVSSVELLETQLVNAVAPFVLNARLKPLLMRSAGRHQHVVNVSAVEGQFYRRFKTTKHPHTNMAKAALNMMTRTSAAEYHADGIHMNSVDTGWVSDEDPVHLAERKLLEQRFHPPLDIVDGAARIVDPIISGHNTGVHVWGQFLKDYEPTDW